VGWPNSEPRQGLVFLARFSLSCFFVCFAGLIVFSRREFATIALLLLLLGE